MLSNAFGGKTYEHLTEPKNGPRKTMADSMAENERRVSASLGSTNYESNDEIQKASATMRGKSYHLVLSELILKIERLEARIAELESK